jgi:hypothetical protein
MLGGVSVLGQRSWQELSQGARIGLLVAVALVFALAGIAAAGGRLLAVRREPGNARRRLVGLLLGLTSVPAGTAVAIALDSDPYRWLIGSLVGLVIALAGLALVPTAAGLVIAVMTSGAVLIALNEEVLHASALTTGLLTVGLGLAWTVLAGLRWVPTWQLGLALGTWLMLVGAQIPMGAGETGPTWTYGLTAALAVGCFVSYRWVRSIVLLVVGVLSATIAVPEAVSDWVHGDLANAVALLAAGGALVGASVLGLWLRRAASGPALTH